MSGIYVFFLTFQNNQNLINVNMNAGENSNMNMNLIMPGGRGLENSKCWLLRYVCILLRFAAGDKETELEKLAKKVLLIFAGYSFNDFRHQEMLKAEDIISTTNEKCRADFQQPCLNTLDT